MARPTLLTEEQIQYLLEKHPLWLRSGNMIVRYFAPANFVGAIGIINSIAILAERYDHHPDIHLTGWNKVQICFSTHDQGGLTELDFRLAAELDALQF